ncbi:MAG: hypothetical protein ACLU38_13615 [Dysosmobacter sp.]
MEKKRDREQGGILGGVAELFDLPVDVVAGLPRLELIGNRQLYLERATRACWLTAIPRSTPTLASAFCGSEGNG